MANALLPRPDNGSNLSHIRPDRKQEAARVASELDLFCSRLEPGDKIPTHTVLMTQFGASERTVLRVLDDMFRAGRIVRRKKAGTFVAQSPAIPPSAPQGIGLANRSIVAIAKPDHAFFSRSVELLYRLAKASGLAVVFQPVEQDTEVAMVSPSDLRGPAGYVVIGSGLITLAEKIRTAGYRCVAIGEVKAGQPCGVANVHADSAEAGFLCADHLIKLGHRRLGFAMDIDTARWHGHQRAVAEAEIDGLDVHTVHISTELAAHWKSTTGAAHSYFHQQTAPTGLCLWNDSVALDTIRTLIRDGVRVPDDVSVVGYDNLPQGQISTPSLTTIDANIPQQMRAALMLLTQDIPPTSATTVMMSPSLIVRGSTRAV